MNKEIVSEMVDDIINEKITEFIESISCDEFLEEVTDRLIEGGIPVDVENEEEVEGIKEIVGGKVVNYLMKQILPKNNVIEVDVSFYHPDDNETKKVYDEEGMREEFEHKLNSLIKNAGI